MCEEWWWSSVYTHTHTLPLWSAGRTRYRIDKRGSPFNIDCVIQFADWLISDAYYIIWLRSLAYGLGHAYGAEIRDSDFWFRLKFGYLVGVQFVRLLAEVWVVCWVFTEVVAKGLGPPITKAVCVCACSPMIIITCWLFVVWSCIWGWGCDCNVSCLVFGLLVV